MGHKKGSPFLPHIGIYLHYQCGVCTVVIKLKVCLFLHHTTDYIVAGTGSCEPYASSAFSLESLLLCIYESMNWHLQLDYSRELEDFKLFYILFPLSLCAIPEKQCVQGNCISIQGNRRWPLIGQMGCQFLSGPQIIVLQHCAKTECRITSYWPFNT